MIWLSLKTLWKVWNLMSPREGQESSRVGLYRFSLFPRAVPGKERHGAVCSHISLLKKPPNTCKHKHCPNRPSLRLSSRLGLESLIWMLFLKWSDVFLLQGPMLSVTSSLARLVLPNSKGLHCFRFQFHTRSLITRRALWIPSTLFSSAFFFFFFTMYCQSTETLPPFTTSSF